jgi:hypothetical protein
MIARKMTPTPSTMLGVVFAMRKYPFDQSQCNPPIAINLPKQPYCTLPFFSALYPKYLPFAED